MKRKDFVKKGLFGMGGIIAIPSVLTRCKEDDSLSGLNDDGTNIGDCALSPTETAGPFPIKTPAELVRENIIADRTGVALLINIIIQDQSADCNPLSDVYVDIWHCDKDGYYSEYGGTQMQPQDFTDAHFLRGRQKTNTMGEVSFISIYPGWYRGRAPHIHLEVLDNNENSILVSQIAFPEDISETVYSSEGYNGSADTSNSRDNIFSNSLEGNMADAISGNITDGYTLTKTIIV